MQVPDGWYPPPGWHGDESKPFTETSKSLKEYDGLFDFTTARYEARDPDKNTTQVYLFQPSDDSEERNDLPSENPDLVKQMMARLHQLMNGAMPRDGHQGHDPTSNLKHFGGFRTPWPVVEFNHSKVKSSNTAHYAFAASQRLISY